MHYNDPNPKANKKPAEGQDTHDGDPTHSIQKIQHSLAGSQGGTQFVGSTKQARDKIVPSSDGNNHGPDIMQGDMRDGPEYYTRGEYETRDFGPEDNSTPDGGQSGSGYGDFRI